VRSYIAVVTALVVAASTVAGSELAVIRPAQGAAVEDGGAARLDEAKPSEAPRLVVPFGQRVVVEGPAENGLVPVSVIDLPVSLRRGFMDRRNLVTVSSENPFADVPPGHWAAPSIAELSRAGVVQGFEDAFFGGKAFTRYEMSAVMARMLRNLEATIERKVDVAKRVSAVPAAAGVSTPTSPTKHEHPELLRLQGQLAELSSHIGSLREGLAKVRELQAPKPAAMGRSGMHEGERQQLAELEARLAEQAAALEARQRKVEELVAKVKVPPPVVVTPEPQATRAPVPTVAPKGEPMASAAAVAKLQAQVDELRQTVRLAMRLAVRAQGRRPVMVPPDQE